MLSRSSLSFCLLTLFSLATTPVFAHHKDDHYPPGHYKHHHKHEHKHHKHHHKHHKHHDHHGHHSSHTVTTVHTVNNVYPTNQTRYNNCHNCGVVLGVNTIVVKGSTSGVGAVTGAVVGGVLGNQIGSGSGKQVATVVGVVSGGVIGHEIERKHATPSTRYEVKVKMHDGSLRMVNYDQRPSWNRGDRVLVQNGLLVSR